MALGNEGDLVTRELLEKIAAGENLSRAEAERVMEQILSGELGTDQIIAFCWLCGRKARRSMRS